IDVFGKVRRTIEAAGAQYEASVEDYHDVMVTLFAEVALAYTEVRGTQQRIVYARENVENQRESLALALDRWENGVTSKLDVAQAQANLAATRASIPTLEIKLNHDLNRLAVLLGQDAGSLQAELGTAGPIPTPGESIGTGLPADILRRRPDIRRSERLLAAQTAQIGVATADLYPRFSIGGFIGLQSRSLASLFDGSSVTFGLGVPIKWNIFNGGRVRANIRVQDEKANQRLLQYRKSVLVAVEEVEDAIAGFNLNRTRGELLEEATAAIGEAVELVLVQYENGLTDFNNVLVTQRDLQFQQDRLVATETDAVLNLIALYKALGGGWEVEEAGGSTAGVTEETPAPGP
ncbi:MAG: efflux transporter outer membrane subunit, partial [Acidobacteriota bacterium]|nr:efflux transporter outer membrane subunit [Acidobacteriota bacterium]